MAQPQTLSDPAYTLWFEVKQHGGFDGDGPFVTTL